MSISNFSSKVKIAVLKGMEAVGTSASNMASNAKLKVNEINLENKRREILTNFSLQAFELWQKGVPLPDPLAAMLAELSEIEDRLSVLRAQKYAKVPADACPRPDATEAQPAADADFETAAPAEAATQETPEILDEAEASAAAAPPEGETPAADTPAEEPSAPNAAES